MPESKLGKEDETNTCVDSQGGDARPDATHPESGWVSQRPPCADEHALASVAIEFVFPSTTDAKFVLHGSCLDVGSTPCGPLSNAEVPTPPLNVDASRLEVLARTEDHAPAPPL